MSGFVLAANCPPSIPKTYVGNVYYDAGTFSFKELLDSYKYSLRALIGQDIVGYGEVIGGNYSIRIEPCFGDTGEIKFVINGVEAFTTGFYDGQEDWGVEEELDIIFYDNPPHEDTCGDNAIQLGEECDGINLGAVNSCGEGWTGIVSCASNCEIDYSNCSMSSYCGDGTCDSDETCSNCPSDCEVCSTPVNDNFGGSSGGGSSGGGVTILNSGVSKGGGVLVPDEADNSESKFLEMVSPKNDVSFFSGFTGAVVGFAGSAAGIVVGVFVLLIVGGFVAIQVTKKSR